MPRSLARDPMPAPRILEAVMTAASGDRPGAARARAAGRRGRPAATARRGADGAVVDVSRARAQPQRRPARPISRVRGVRAAGAEGVRADRRRSRRRAGRACGWRCTTGSGASRSARPASRSPPPRRIAPTRFAACRYAIERVKQIAPIWKREFFDGGDVWIEGATADPDDAAARAEAERVACA